MRTNAHTWLYFLRSLGWWELHGLTWSYHISYKYIYIIYWYNIYIYIYIIKVYLLDFDSSRMPTVGIQSHKKTIPRSSPRSPVHSPTCTLLAAAPATPQDFATRPRGCQSQRLDLFGRSMAKQPTKKESDYLTWNHEWILATSQEIVKFWQKIKLLSDQGWPTSMKRALKDEFTIWIQSSNASSAVWCGMRFYKGTRWRMSVSLKNQPGSWPSKQIRKVRRRRKHLKVSKSNGLELSCPPLMSVA